MRGRNFIEQEAHAPLGAGWFTIDHQNLNLEEGGALKDANVGGNKGQT